MMLACRHSLHGVPNVHSETSAHSCLLRREWGSPIIHAQAGGLQWGRRCGSFSRLGRRLSVLTLRN